MSESYAELEKVAGELGLTLEFQFQPQIFPDGTKTKDMSMKWLVTVMHLGKGLVATTYTQGVAHCPSCPKHKFGRRFTQHEYDNLLRDCAGQGVGNHPPEPLDALWSIARDCQTVMQNGSFEEWAREFGYDEDSRKAEAIYNECVKHYLAIKRSIGDEGIDRIANVER
jgi:hypothetical protein